MKDAARCVVHVAHVLAQPPHRGKVPVPRLKPNFSLFTNVSRAVKCATPHSLGGFMTFCNNWCWREITAQPCVAGFISTRYRARWTNGAALKRLPPRNVLLVHKKHSQHQTNRAKLSSMLYYSTTVFAFAFDPAVRANTAASAVFAKASLSAVRTNAAAPAVSA